MMSLEKIPWKDPERSLQLLMAFTGIVPIEKPLRSYEGPLWSFQDLFYLVSLKVQNVYITYVMVKAPTGSQGLVNFVSYLILTRA